jgi:hypothetical protein
MLRCTKPLESATRFGETRPEIEAASARRAIRSVAVSVQVVAVYRMHGRCKIGRIRYPTDGVSQRSLFIPERIVDVVRPLVCVAGYIVQSPSVRTLLPNRMRTTPTVGWRRGGGWRGGNDSQQTEPSRVRRAWHPAQRRASRRAQRDHASEAKNRKGSQGVELPNREMQEVVTESTARSTCALSYPTS